MAHAVTRVLKTREALLLLLLLKNVLDHTDLKNKRKRESERERDMREKEREREREREREGLVIEVTLLSFVLDCPFLSTRLFVCSHTSAYY